MTRRAWKAYHRRLRIARREALKAAMDMSLFGTGIVRVSADGHINHILPQSVTLHG